MDTDVGVDIEKYNKDLSVAFAPGKIWKCINLEENIRSIMGIVGGDLQVKERATIMGMIRIQGKEVSDKEVLIQYRRDLTSRNLTCEFPNRAIRSPT